MAKEIFFFIRLLVVGAFWGIVFVACLSLFSCKSEKKQSGTLYQDSMLEDCIIEGSCGANAKYKLYKNGMLEIFGEGPMEDYEYSEANKKNDTPWASYNDEIKEIKIEGVTSIGSYAFGDLMNVKNIVIPPSVQSVHKSAFSGMKQLEKITFQGDIDYIGDYAFASCKALYKIIFEGMVNGLGSACFMDNERLQELTIPEGCSILPDAMCSHCSNLKSLRIPNTVKYIGLAFHDCPELENVELPTSLEYLDMGTFFNDVKIKEIVIPKSVSHIERFEMLSPNLERKITILSENMPSMDCIYQVKLKEILFDVYVPYNLLSEYKKNKKLEAISDHIYSIESGTSTTINYNDEGDVYSASNSNYGGANGSGSNTSREQYNASTRRQPTKHPCNLCNGQKRIVKDLYPALYGQPNYQVKCSECGGYFMRSTGHTHIPCPQCHGRGYFITE